MLLLPEEQVFEIETKTNRESFFKLKDNFKPEFDNKNSTGGLVKKRKLVKYI